MDMEITASTSKMRLLPSGFSDMLPRLARNKITSTNLLLNSFMGFGYAPVIPTMLEYSSSMFTPNNQTDPSQYFHLQDVKDGKILALRADITPQISRMAQSSLANAARPLKLCYAATRICRQAQALQTRREHLQIGLEFIGATDLNAEAEVIGIAAIALQGLGLRNLSLDIHLPHLTREMIAALPESARENATIAIARKDPEALDNSDDSAQAINWLMQHHTSLTEAIAAFAKSNIASIAQAAIQLKELQSALKAKGCDIAVNVDALNSENIDSYYCGIDFSIFAHSAADSADNGCSQAAFEVARGGRYRLENGEEAVGFTLYLEEILPQLKSSNPTPLVALSDSITLDEARQIQAQGWRSCYCDINDMQALQKQDIHHIYQDGKIIPTPSKP
jgi:ATP phosphoribosyltransferase regulatory subunit